MTILKRSMTEPLPGRSRNTVRWWILMSIVTHSLEVHIQTYRTPDYLLSCAQDYRAGKPGYQHIWQATLTTRGLHQPPWL